MKYYKTPCDRDNNGSFVPIHLSSVLSKTCPSKRRESSFISLYVKYPSDFSTMLLPKYAEKTYKTENAGGSSVLSEAAAHMFLSILHGLNVLLSRWRFGIFLTGVIFWILSWSWQMVEFMALQLHEQWSFQTMNDMFLQGRRRLWNCWQRKRVGCFQHATLLWFDLRKWLWWFGARMRVLPKCCMRCGFLILLELTMMVTITTILLLLHKCMIHRGFIPILFDNLYL